MLDFIEPAYVTIERKDLKRLKELVAEIDNDRHKFNLRAFDSIIDILEKYET